MYISVSLAKPGGGGGAEGQFTPFPPPPYNTFSEFCRGTFENVSVHVTRQVCHYFCTNEVSEVPTKYWKKQFFNVNIF